MNINLKEFRDAYGYSQQDLADALCVSQSAVSRTENVGAELSGPQIERLCERFGKEKVMPFVNQASFIKTVSTSTIDTLVSIIAFFKEQYEAMAQYNTDLIAENEQLRQQIIELTK